MPSPLARLALRCAEVVIAVACVGLCVSQILNWRTHQVWDNVAALEFGAGMIIFTVQLEPLFFNRRIRRSLGRFIPPFLMMICVLSLILALALQVVYMLNHQVRSHAFDASLLLALMGFCADVGLFGLSYATLRTAIHLGREARTQT